jgi:hypothetical protein
LRGHLGDDAGLDLFLDRVDDLGLERLLDGPGHVFLDLLDDVGLDLLLDRLDDLGFERLLDGPGHVLLDLLDDLLIEDVVERLVEKLSRRRQAERHGAEQGEYARQPSRGYVKAGAAGRMVALT